jgi:hypothetical protein
MGRLGEILLFDPIHQPHKCNNNNSMKAGCQPLAIQFELYLLNGIKAPVNTM